MSTALGAFLEGWRRALRAPAVTIGLAAVTLLTALLFDRSIDDLRSYRPQTPLTGDQLRSLTAYILLWMFLTGGILDRFARARPIRTSAFFAACGEYGVRFLRLGLIIGPLYWAVWAWLHPYLFGTIWGRWVNDLTTQRDAITVRVVLYVILVLVLAVIGLISAYAQVRTVVEDRRSVVGTVGAAIRFIRRRPLRILGLLFLNVFGLAAVARLWYSAAPVPGDSDVYTSFVTLLFLVLFVLARLAWMAAEIVFFQGELAHATYTAAPLPTWPDSPAAEALENLTRRSNL
jgi:hypothetical protein